MGSFRNCNEQEALNGRIQQRHLEASFFGLEKLFTLCNLSFEKFYGKYKWHFGNTLFYLNHYYKWSKKGSGTLTKSSGRVILGIMPKNDIEYRKVYSRALVNCRLKKHVLIILKEKSCG